MAPHPEGAPFPASVAGLLAGNEPADEYRIEHISLHPHAQPGPVVGLFIQAASLAVAEAGAARAWQRATAAQPALAQWRMVSAEVPLMRQDPDS
ncbi:hypothetical protein [Streptomyces sp. NBC_00859]|uniref:hypothetical protein n=1 Tax=Streptomyces sp. NBC_00859 TaxID=2903682 RepID=UPI00386C3C8B|nr:hypothetical protein OG584_02790 [Streptomyces sp. NBC_00859]